MRLATQAMADDLEQILALVRNNSLAALREVLAQLPGTQRSAIGRTPLHAAAEEGNAEAARLLLEAGFAVEARTDDGETPLHYAARYGRGINLLLLEGGAGSRGGVVPTHPQVRAAFWAIFRKLHPGLPADQDDFEAAGPVLSAASDEAQMQLIFDRETLQREYAAMGIDVDALEPDYGHFLRGYPGYLEVASLLIERGADVNARNQLGGTPLHLAIECGETAMVDLLLRQGAAWNLPGPDEINRYEPPLVYAVFYARLDVAKLLHAHGATMNWELWPLHNAASSGRLELVTWLLEIGGDMNQADSYGHTPIMSAAEGHHEVVSALCERGATLEGRNANGQTALHLAAACPQCVRPLLKRGAVVDVKDEEGRTPLHFAAGGLADESIRLLVNAGAKVDAQDHQGNTPLHTIFFGDELRPDIEFPTFQALVEAGANRAVRNHEGKTAFDLAMQWDYPSEYLRLLQA